MSALKEVQQGIAVLRSQSRSLHDAVKLIDAAPSNQAVEPQVLLDLLALSADAPLGAARALLELLLDQQLSEEDRALVVKRLGRLPAGEADRPAALKLGLEIAERHTRGAAVLGSAALAAVNHEPAPEGDRLAAFEGLFWRGGALTALSQSFDADDWHSVGRGFQTMLEQVGDEGVLRELASLLFSCEQPNGAWAVCNAAVRSFPESVDCRVQRVMLGAKTSLGTPELLRSDLEYAHARMHPGDDRLPAVRELLALFGQSLQKRPPMA